MAAERARTPYQSEVRLILRIAMVLFIYTVVIGILNGLDLVEFERKALLAHLHVGTLGWLTMAVFAGSLWLFGTAGGENETMRWVARSAPIVALLYNVAFLTTDGIARPILGALMLLLIVVFFAWATMRARVTPLSVPHLAMLAGLATSVVGAVLGILSGVRLAIEDTGLSETIAGAHPATMVVGFLVPVAMGFIEWVMRPESTLERATRGGWLQIGLPFAGGVVLMIGVLLGSVPIISLNLPLEVIGIVIFLARLGRPALRVSLVDAAPARHAALAIPFLVVNIAILVYLIGNYADDFEAAPRRLALALDHSIFVGVLTNAILGLLAGLSLSQRPVWIDHAVFWGFNVGIAAFIVGLIADESILLRIFTPVLGVAILLAIATHLGGVVIEWRARKASPATP